jgi:hypothetical protein
MRMHPRSALTLCALVLSSASCDRKRDDTRSDPASGALSASTADPATTAWHFTVDPSGSTQVDMPGLNEHIQGATSVAAGTLEIVAADLAQSRGLVRVDLASFATHTFGDQGKDATQSKHARTWLEVVVDDRMNEPLRWAEFAIRSIDGLSATDVRTVAPVREGADDVRTIAMTVHGELMLHGHKLPKDDPVVLALHYAPGAAPGSEPKRIEIASKAPMRVVLKEYDVSPRDPAGQLLSWTTNLISKVADTADVTVALTATPRP